MSLSQRGGQKFRATAVRRTHGILMGFRSSPRASSESYNGTLLRQALAPVTPRLDKGLHHRSLDNNNTHARRKTRWPEEEAGVAIRYLISVAEETGARFLCGSDAFGALLRPGRPRHFTL